MKKYILAALVALFVLPGLAMATQKSRSALQTDLLTDKYYKFNAETMYENMVNMSDSHFNLTTDDINDLTGTAITTIDINGGTIDGAAVGLSAALTGLIGPAEVATADPALTQAECGKTVFLNSATEFVTTLPSPKLGCNFSVIVKAAPSGASYTVVTDGSDIIYGVSTAIDGGAAGAAEDTVSLVNGQAVVGDRVDLTSDGTNWYAVGFSSNAAGITFSSAI